MLKAGVSRTAITPPLTVPHGGWGAQTHVLPEGVHQDLWTTALYLAEANGDPASSVVLVDVDLCLLSMDLADQIRDRIAAALGIDRIGVRVSATHTHAGPVLRSSWFKDQASIEAYVDCVVSQTVAAAEQASLDPRPVRIAAGSGFCDVGKQRTQMLEDGRVITGYNPNGPSDPTVSVVKLEAEDGSLLASLVHYACHPTTLGPENKLVSPDYPGTVKRVVESLTGGTCLFLQGATGDVGPGPEGFRANYAAVERMGKSIGFEAAKALLETDAVPSEWRFEEVVESGASLGMWLREPTAPRNDCLRVAIRTIELPTKIQPPPEELEREFIALRDRMQELIDGNGPKDQIRDATYKVKRAHKFFQQSRRYYGQASSSIEAHIILIGDIALVGLPVEPFCITGRTVRERSPFAHTLFSGYSNGSVGYLPTAEHYETGGYEVDSSPFAAGAAELLTEKIIDTLQELYREEGGISDEIAG